jgi:type VI protein secretion system component Hcp
VTPLRRRYKGDSTVRVLASLLTLLALAAAPTARAAGPRPVGTMTIPDHSDLQNLPVFAVQWTARNTLTIGGGGAGIGKVVFDAFTVTKAVDASSPALLALTFGGDALATVRIDVSIRHGVTATYELTDAILVGNERHSPDGGGPLVQDLSFAVAAIRETVTSPGGSVTSCFDIKAAKSCDGQP